MPQRPRSHEIEDISRQRLRSIFSKLGWVVWDLYPDYGEDLLVRVFIEAKATHYSFFVQAKGTDKIEKYIQKEGTYISYPIDIEHIEHWKNFSEPVIITVWDAKSDTTYWEIIQDYLGSKNLNTSKKRKSMSIHIPIINVLDEKGLNTIFIKTKERYKRFERINSSISILIKFLEEHFNTEVHYDEDTEVVIIDDKKGPADFFFFGETAQRMNEFVTEFNMTYEQFFEEAILGHITREDIDIECSENGNILVFSEEDELLEVYKNKEEFMTKGLDKYGKKRNIPDSTSNK